MDIQEKEETVPFVHLHNHTDYSTYDGFMSPLELSRRAKELDMPAVAISDHGKIGGFLKFFKACKGEKRPEDPKKLKKFNPKWEKSIKPILGVELYMSLDLSIKKTERFHILLLAKNNIGLRNIYKLCSIGHQHTAYNFPRIDFEILKRHKEGLIVSTACIGGEFSQLVKDGDIDGAYEFAKKYHDVWGDDFYLEVMFTDKPDSELGKDQIEVIKVIRECSKKLGIKVIATNDAHYVKEENAEFQRIKKTISSRRPLEHEDSHEYYLKSYDEMAKIFSRVGKDWLQNTVDIADKCNVEIEFGNLDLPEFKIPENDEFNEYKKPLLGKTEEQSYLRYLSFKGLKEKGLDEKQNYIERLDSELETIMFTGFDRYFLIVEEYCAWTRNKGVRIGLGRGSGCGSLVLYCLKVTGIDPIKYNLSMDRFLYCESEYHFGPAEIYSDGKNREWKPKGLGNRYRKNTEEDIRKFSSIRELCKKKLIETEASDEQRKRIVKELKFFFRNTSLIYDLFETSIVKKEKGVGDINCPNSYLLELLNFTNKKADLSKDIWFNYLVDKEQSRISPPDIDIDFEERDGLLEHLCELYGLERVALIGTTGTYKPKAAVQFTAKAIGIVSDNNPRERRFSAENDQEGKRLSKIMTNLPLSLKQWLGEDNDFKPPNARITECIKQLKAEKERGGRYAKLFKIAKKLEGKIRAYGTHPAGIVISSRDITDDVPLHVAKVQKDTSSEINGNWDGGDSKISINLMTTQYDMDEVESLGLLKFDLLQLQTLRQISLTLDLIKERYGELDFDIDTLETNDPRVFRTINSMKLEGLFQISGDAFTGKDWPRKDKKTGETLRDKDGNVMYFHAKGVMEIIGCDCFNDIVAANALGRPGPLALDMPKKYAEGKRNPDKVKYSHDDLIEILQPTYGELCYQEQLISMAQKLAGFTFAEADGLRKACAKKKKEMLDVIEPKFRKGCKANKIPEDVIEEMFSIIIEFGSYAFNRSHSTAYGAMCYQTAYLKTYYPAEFMSSLLTSAASTSDDKLDIVSSKLQEEYPKLDILKPTINGSGKSYVPVGASRTTSQIIAPFFSLKGVGKKLSDSIVTLRDRERGGTFSCMREFLAAVNSGGKSIVTNSIGTLLIESGVFEEFGTKNQMKKEMMEFNAIKKITPRKGKSFTDPTILRRMTNFEF